MVAIRSKILSGILGLLVIGIGVYVYFNVGSDDVDSSQKFDLVVYPENWTVEGSGTSGMNMIAVKGKNGFSGEVKLSVSGLPFGVLDSDADPSDYYYCSSHCQASPNGDFPFTLNVKDGEWTSLGPTLYTSKSGIYNVTVTAEAGGTTLEKKFTVNLLNKNGAASPQFYATFNQVEFKNTANKISLNAGESKTITFDVYNRNTAVSGSLESNLSDSGLRGVTDKITGGFSKTSFSLDAKGREAVQMEIKTAS